jgi:hypothetical protein
MNCWEALALVFLINALFGNPIADMLAAIRGCPQVTNNYTCDCSNCPCGEDE